MQTYKNKFAKNFKLLIKAKINSKVINRKRDEVKANIFNLNSDIKKGNKKKSNLRAKRKKSEQNDIK